MLLGWHCEFCILCGFTLIDLCLVDIHLFSWLIHSIAVLCIDWRQHHQQCFLFYVFRLICSWFEFDFGILPSLVLKLSAFYFSGSSTLSNIGTFPRQLGECREADFQLVCGLNVCIWSARRPIANVEGTYWGEHWAECQDNKENLSVGAFLSRCILVDFIKLLRRGFSGCPRLFSYLAPTVSTFLIRKPGAKETSTLSSQTLS